MTIIHTVSVLKICVNILVYNIINVKQRVQIAQLVTFNNKLGR